MSNRNEAIVVDVIGPGLRWTGRWPQSASNVPIRWPFGPALESQSAREAKSESKLQHESSTVTVEKAYTLTTPAVEWRGRLMCGLKCGLISVSASCVRVDGCVSASDSESIFASISRKVC